MNKLKKKLKRISRENALEKAALKIQLEHETYRAWEAENKLRYHTEQYDLLLKKMDDWQTPKRCEATETKPFLTHTDAVCDKPLDKDS